MDLIVCPYYQGREGQYPGNCWEEHPWSDFPDSCNVPGNRQPLCDPKKNGWKKEDGKNVFRKHVSKAKLEKALKKHSYKESLKPEDIVRRLKVLEAKLEKLSKRH